MSDAPRDPKDPVGECKSCHEVVVWATTSSGKKMPMDVNPDDAGEFYLFRRRDGGIDAVYVRAADPRLEKAQLRGDNTYRCHFATCPNADDHRRRSQP